MELIAPDLRARFREVRQATTAICEPLLPEDYVVQPMPDVSPPKWHLGHTTWFFETFLLQQFDPEYKVFHADFNYIFNSYYESVGERVVRANRGNLSRPSTKEVMAFRVYVDEAMDALLLREDLPQEAWRFLEVGLQHEQQHQELMYTDIKYILGTNPLFPVYKAIPQQPSAVEMGEWLCVEDGLYSVGHQGDGFCWDNELGAHQVYLEGFEARKNLVTNGEFASFMEQGGYEQFQWWLSEGWEWVKANGVQSPLYWYHIDGVWHQYTFAGLQRIDPNAPVTHVSFFEADAFASWKGQRLLTEFEWEVFCQQHAQEDLEQGNFADHGLLHPQAPNGHDQLLGTCWEWTNSAYLPYPRYQKAEGALGEYNGKFMVNQMVLRGGSCVTPMSHIRHTYRNFFHTAAQWQFTGIRLAK